MLLKSLQPETKRIDSDCYVEGYASTFERYHLCGDGDNAIYEQFERNAFDGTDMTDVILQYDHEGSVYARTTNGTLQLDVDDVGLFVCADLSRTRKGKDLYEDIEAGNVTKMSFRFKCDSYFDPKTRTHVVTKVNKIYDVSAVSIPANDTTSIEARTREAAEREREMKRTQIKLKLLEMGE